GITVARPTPLAFDEPWFMATIPLLKQWGFSVEFLRRFPGAPGPLYTVVQFALEPITHLRPPGIRLVNLSFLGTLILEIWGLLRMTGLSKDAGAQALAIMGIPILWTMSGLAMTEVPAMAFLIGSLLLLVFALANRPTPIRVLLGSLAGLCLGLA